MLVLTCHNPGLRDGNSAASAGIVTIGTGINVTPINRAKFSCLARHGFPMIGCLVISFKRSWNAELRSH